VAEDDGLSVHVGPVFCPDGIRWFVPGAIDHY
jgi:hypothetical protein